MSTGLLLLERERTTADLPAPCSQWELLNAREESCLFNFVIYFSFQETETGYDSRKIFLNIQIEQWHLNENFPLENLPIPSCAKRDTWVLFFFSCFYSLTADWFGYPKSIWAGPLGTRKTTVCTCRHIPRSLSHCHHHHHPWGHYQHHHHHPWGHHHHQDPPLT